MAAGTLRMHHNFLRPDLTQAVDNGLWVGEFGARGFGMPSTDPSTFTMNGGSVVIDDHFDALQVGRLWDSTSSTFSDGVVNFNAGTITVQGTEINPLTTMPFVSETNIGLDGYAVWNQPGGTLNAEIVHVGHFASPQSSVNLSGNAVWNQSSALLVSDGQTLPEFQARPEGVGSADFNVSGSNVAINTVGLFLRGQANLNFVADSGGVSAITNSGSVELSDTVIPGNRPNLSVDVSAVASSNSELLLVDGTECAFGFFEGMPEGHTDPSWGNRTLTYQAGTDGFDIALVDSSTYLDPGPCSPPVADAQIGRWSMDPAGPGPFAEGNPATLDVRLGTNEGTLTRTFMGQAAPVEEDHLWFFSADNGHVFTTSNDVPSNAMFINGNDAGSVSYDASAVEESFAEGALFFPQDVYGNEFSLEGSFSIETFFKTSDGTNPQQLIVQGEGFARYGLSMNEVAGGLSLCVNDGGLEECADIGGSTGIGNANYGDGEWHYVLATYEEGAGANGTGQLMIAIANEDGTTAFTTVDLSAAFGGLPPAFNDGNFLVGARDFDGQGAMGPIDPKRFDGLIDEVQVSAGLVPFSERLGFLDLPNPVTCDFDGDTDCDLDDIDLLTMEVSSGGGDLMFDLNGDNQVNGDDITQWLNDAGGMNIGAAYLAADANLDGNVDGQDFVIWNNNKFTATGKWSQADFNADGNTNGQDFVVWNNNKFQSSDSFSAVPEPSFGVTLLVSLFWVFQRCRVRN